MENIKELLHELRCDIACIPRSDENKEEIKNATETLLKAWDLASKSDFLPCVSNRFNDEKFIANVCISYRHDYGLLDEGARGLIEAEVKDVMRAIKNNAPYGR